MGSLNSMKSILFILFIFNLFLQPFASAMYTEFGLSQSYKKTSFSEFTTAESEMLSGSVSFYLWENAALELSYTKGLVVQKEKDVVQPTRTVTQHSTVYGTDIVIAFAEKRSTFQPFIKGGAAYIEKKQVTQDEGTPSFETNLPARYVPSYGVGIKIKLTDAFGVSTSLDVWKDDSTSTNDIASRTGITWMF